MKKTKPWLTRAAAVAIAAVFFLLNRGAYQSFFQDDEFDTLSWITDPPWGVWLRGLVNPVFDPNNFRPVGDFYYFAVHHFFGLHFPAYVAVLQVVHLCNAWLVFRLARKLGVRELGAWASALFFAVNMAAMDAFWKPMYVFDLLCCTFCLMSVLLFAYGRWVLSFGAFWLAYKAKEVAVMLPVVLLLLDWRRWRMLVPFFAVSLSFGAQAMAANRTREDLYAFRFTAEAVMRTLAFYCWRVLPGLAVLPFVFREKTVRWTVAAVVTMFVPLLLLPDRLFAAYAYVPLAFLAVGMGAVAGLHRPVFTLLFFLVWLPRDLHELRAGRRTILAAAEESRPYFDGLVKFARTHEKPAALLYDGLPVGYHAWGITGMARCAFGDPVMEATYLRDPKAAKLMESGTFAILTWDKPGRRASFVVGR